MRCPYCQCENTQVKDSRPTEEATVIRRRRVCSVCGGRFTTFERVQLRELFVLKKSGRCELFDRDKLMRSVNLAIRKRDIDSEHIEQAISGIVRQLESLGEPEISSEKIGHLVLESLKGIDDIAYIRFASVYRDFRNASDFHNVIDELSKDTTDIESGFDE